VEFLEEEALVQDGEGGMNDSKEQFYELVSAVLNEGLYAVYVFGVLVDAWIIG